MKGGATEAAEPNLTELQRTVLLAMAGHGGTWPESSGGGRWNWNNVSGTRQIMEALRKKGAVEHVEHVGFDRYEMSPVGWALAKKGTQGDATSAQAAETAIGKPRVHRQDTHELNADIVKGPIAQDANGHEFRIDHVYVRWTRVDGKWWSLWDCNLAGPRILKSGKESETLRGKWEVREETIPDWLAPWLKENGPPAS